MLCRGCNLSGPIDLTKYNNCWQLSKTLLWWEFHFLIKIGSSQQKSLYILFRESVKHRLVKRPDIIGRVGSWKNPADNLSGGKLLLSPLSPFHTENWIHRHRRFLSWWKIGTVTYALTNWLYQVFVLVLACLERLPASVLLLIEYEWQACGAKWFEWAAFIVASKIWLGSGLVWAFMGLLVHKIWPSWADCWR